MALVIDRRNELAGQAGCHALIVGVSDYANLTAPDSGQPPGPFGLHKLASTALTGYRMYKWLEKHQESLWPKLATCRVLLAPSPEEVAVEPALEDWPHDCRFATFAQAASDWRDDCASSAENLTFFYFAGHGIQRTLEDSILLLQDFGTIPGNPMINTTSLNNLFAGMAPHSSAPTMALSQIYFVDACREFPDELADFDVLNPGQVFMSRLGGRDDRKAPIFFAAVPGSTAYAIRGKATVFGSALLECMDIAAEVREDADGNMVYEVGSDSLEDCLNSYFASLHPAERRDQEIMPGGGLAKNVPIHRLEKAPEIPVIIDLSPLQSFSEVEIVFEDEAGSVETFKRRLPEQAPIEIPRRLGGYSLEVKPDPHVPTNYRRIQPVTPPRFTWRVRAL